MFYLWLRLRGNSQAPYMWNWRLDDSSLKLNTVIVIQQNVHSCSKLSHTETHTHSHTNIPLTSTCPLK